MRTTTLLLLAILGIMRVPAQNIVPVKVKAVLAADQTGASIKKLRSLNGKAYFAAIDATSGYEPWVTDGTAAGTVMLKDCYPGAASGTGMYFEPVAFGQKVYFTATTTANVVEVFVTDGTPGGTVPFPAFSALSPSFQPEETAIADGKLYCRCNPLITWMGTSTRYKGLCRTDGTPAGTTIMAKWKNAGNMPFWFAALGSNVLFEQGSEVPGTGQTNDAELWMCDGEPHGAVIITGQEHTRQLKDIWPGIGSSWPWYLTEFSGKVYFSATAVGSGSNYNVQSRQLYQTDGTANGTQRIWEFNASTAPHGSNPSLFIPISPYQLLYTATAGNPFNDLQENLWSMTLKDNAAPSFTQITDINPGGASSISRGIGSAGRAYFAATKGGVKSGRIIQVDRIPNLQLGTFRLVTSEIFPQITTKPLMTQYPGSFGTMNSIGGRLWFSARYGYDPDAATQNTTSEMVAYDPASKVIRKVKTTSSAANKDPVGTGLLAAPVGNSLIFLANYDNAGFALWKATW